MRIAIACRGRPIWRCAMPMAALTLARVRAEERQPNHRSAHFSTQRIEWSVVKSADDSATTIAAIAPMIAMNDSIVPANQHTVERRPKASARRRV